MALMLLGIGLFGAITATITSYLMTHEMHAVESDRPSATERTTAVESTSSASGSLVSELERLAALHRNGDLTAAEFAAAKRRLLADLPATNRQSQLSAMIPAGRQQQV
jgi:hypothetical protein